MYAVNTITIEFIIPNLFSLKYAIKNTLKKRKGEFRLALSYIRLNN